MRLSHPFSFAFLLTSYFLPFHSISLSPFSILSITTVISIALLFLPNYCFPLSSTFYHCSYTVYIQINEILNNFHFLAILLFSSISLPLKFFNCPRTYFSSFLSFHVSSQLHISYSFHYVSFSMSMFFQLWFSSSSTFCDSSDALYTEVDKIRN